MLTPLPVPLSPGPSLLPLPTAGTLPQRAPASPATPAQPQATENAALAAAFTAGAGASPALVATPLHATAAAPDLPLPGMGAPGAEAAPAALALPAAETLATPPPATGGAAPMSLVVAQMQGGETVAMQALIAQQAASRALPRAVPHHAAPLDDLPRPVPQGAEAALASALLAPQGTTRWPLLPQDETAAPRTQDTAPARDPWTDLATILRRWPPVTPPPDRLPRSATPWLIAGALFAGLFLFVVLSS